MNIYVCLFNLRFMSKDPLAGPNGGWYKNPMHKLMSDNHLNHFTFCHSAQTPYVPSNWIFGQKSCCTQDKCALPPRQNVFPFGGQTRIAWTWKVCRNRCKLGQIQCCGSHGCAVPTDPWLFQKRRTDLERVAYLKYSKASSYPVSDKICVKSM